MDPRNPTFEEVRQLTRNGKERVRVLIYGTSVECRAKTSSTRAQIDFDLHSGNYDLRPEARDRLWDEYNKYRGETKFKTKLRPHFSKDSIWFDVHREDAERWFHKVLRELQDPSVVTLCDAAIEFGDFLKSDAGELLLGALVEPQAKSDDGDIIRLVAPAWLELVRLIQANPNILYEIHPRKLEELIAGAYDKAGFDCVVLTPRSGDLGRDIIAEKHGWGSIRIVEQVKRYAPGHFVTANDVRALGFVVLADPATSKGIITTTSDFAPRIKDDPLIKPFFPTRIELVNGPTLLDRLVGLLHGDKP